jgi:hypothetical protein
MNTELVSSSEVNSQKQASITTTIIKKKEKSQLLLLLNLIYDPNKMESI